MLCGLHDELMGRGRGEVEPGKEKVRAGGR